MKMYGVIIGIWLNMLLCFSTGAVTITIDATQTYQTIEGFGMQDYGSVSPQFLHDDLGLNILRAHLRPSFQPNQPSDLINSNLSNFNVAGIQWMLDDINAFKQYPDMKYWMAIFTPPSWMKDLSRDPYVDGTCADGAGACGGHVKPEMYNALAGYMVAAYKLVLQKTGIKLYGMSIQNEPGFIEWYISCVYTPEEYRDALKAIGKRFEDEGIDIKLMGPEDMAAATRPYFGVINNDPDAKKYLDIFAVHGYIDGIHPMTNSAGANVWKRVGLSAKTIGAQAWMTETSGFSKDWTGASNLAGTIYLALRYADLSGWVFLNYNDFGFPSNTSHSVLSAVSKNFYKYIRPGAKRVSAVSSDSAHTFVVAFSHAINKTLSLVIINDAATATQLSLSGVGLPVQMHKYTTTASKKCADDGMIQSSQVSLEANSVTTLYGENYTPPVVGIIIPKTKESVPVMELHQNDQTYSIDGRIEVDRTSTNSGVRIVKRTGKNGFVTQSSILMSTR